MANSTTMLKNYSPVFVSLVTFALTALIVFVTLNFSSGEKRPDQHLPRLYSVKDPQFKRVMSALLGPAIVGGNKIDELINGDQIFPAMLDAVKGAKSTINFETYIYWSGDIGQAFANALAERAKAGVKVNVLIDWVGSAKMEDDLLDVMRTSGVEIHKFHKPHWYTLAKLNNRTHRKLLIVDGAIGFTGGVGIAEKWTGMGQDADHWRDSHYRVEGPVVAQIQSTFLDNWMKVTGQVLHGEQHFPSLKPAGKSDAQMFSSSPSNGSENMALMYQMALTAAQQSVDLSMAYFVPDTYNSKILVEAMQRGVKLRIITPGSITDTQTVRAASRQTWGPLLKAGAEIYEFQPSMYHCKVMIVDGLMVSVGSTNFDNRSFALNDEANLNVYDSDFAARQTQIFEEDLKKARRVTFNEWNSRPLRERALETVGALLSSQL